MAPGKVIDEETLKSRLAKAVKNGNEEKVRVLKRKIKKLRRTERKGASSAGDAVAETSTKKKGKRGKKKSVDQDAKQDAVTPSDTNTKKKKRSRDDTNTNTAVSSEKSNKRKKSNNKKANSDTAATSSSSSSSSNTDSSDVAKWREAEKMWISESSATFHPCRTFDQVTGISKKLMDSACGGFETPTPIQAQAWPILLTNRDVVGIAETGSGKTLAFALPGLERCDKAIKADNKKYKSGPVRPRMLILAPTRELARQSDEVLREVSKGVGMTSVCIYGGVPKHVQRRELQDGARTRGVVVVATPGRLKDLVNDQVLDLGDVVYLVLDEADRMLDMGFEPDVRAIVAMCADKPTSNDGGSALSMRQTAMFSATWPEDIRKLAASFMTGFVRITIGGDQLTANKRVSQKIEVFAEERDREGRLRALLKDVHGPPHRSKGNRVLVFALYKKEAARIAGSLKRQGYKCAEIHGDMTQKDRENSLASFRDKSLPLLVATDVAARGLDIPDVEVVINYSFPLTIEDYVHRIGRTGRAGKSGASYTFFHNGDKLRAGELVAVLQESNQHVPESLGSFRRETKKKTHSMYGDFFKGGDEAPVAQPHRHITFDEDSD
eukprot:TRINITY_DN150_c0_g1_i1.p1 TRINITY_DN150_c0_g1~~TRINITY_DN150_c0_g1_i1.p1  ORF type:complete len:608 (+),score=193.00 TRINITY_DN150_c0_g1_i1:213-2036(+)